MYNTADTIIKLRSRINKGHSQDYDNIPDWFAVELINKAQDEIVRNLLSGRNVTQEGDEETTLRVDDLQPILVPPHRMEVIDKGIYVESDKFPSNYMYHKRVTPIASNSTCLGKRMRSKLVEESNIDVFMFDTNKRPSFSWRETFHTLGNNKIKVYKSEEFIVDYIELIYYRIPKRFDIGGYIHTDGRSSVDSPLEFKVDVAELIIDTAANIASADLELVNSYQTTKQRIEINK